jgi:hypothetical protein
MKKSAVIVIFVLLGSTLYQCHEPPVYPDVPIVNYESFFVYMDTNSLNQEVLTGNVNFSFTDGDGNLGMDAMPDSVAFGLPDSIRYNLFFQLYDYQNGQFVEIPEEDGGYLKYVIPYLDKQPLQGTISVKIEYPILTYDTIFYTFFMYDRDYNRSNTDSTDVRDLTRY